MTRIHSLLTAPVLALMTVAAGAQQADVDAAASPFEVASSAYERGHWHVAFAVYAALADDCDGEAARIATLMWRHGQTLYHTSFETSAEQVRRWSQVAACVGAPTGCTCTADLARR